MLNVIKLMLLVHLSIGMHSEVFAGGIAKQIAASLKSELLSMQKRLDSDSIFNKKKNGHPDVNKSVFYLKSVTLRLKPFVEFKIPGITKLKIIPRFDFRWQRKPPKGWETL